jgi:hypothetical protein
MKVKRATRKPQRSTGNKVPKAKPPPQPTRVTMNVEGYAGPARHPLPKRWS